MKRKPLWTGIWVCLGMLVLILDGKTALEGAGEGIALCLKTVIPSLFPFFVLSALLTSSLTGSVLPALRPLGRLLGIPKGAESLLIPGFLGGYPVGAQSICAAFRGGQLSGEEAQRMLAFCNNAGPAFLFGMAAAMFPRRWMAWALWAIHIAGAVFAAMLIPRSSGHAVTIRQAAPLSLSDALNASIHVMATVCGWVILFRVLLTFLNRWILWILPAAARVAVTGLLELTNGCCSLMAVTDIPDRMCICSGMLAFGGLCVTMQTRSVTQGLSLRYYYYGKAMQTLFSLTLCGAVVNGTLLPFGTLILIALAVKFQKRSSIPSTSRV